MLSRTFLIIAEHRDGRLRQISGEALQAAKRIGGPGDRYVYAVLGHGVSVASRKLAAYDVERVIAIDHPDLAHYHAELYADAVQRIADTCGADVIITGHTALGRDLAPRLAARLGWGLVSDVTEITRDGEQVRFIRPIYAGKAFEQKEVLKDRFIVSVRVNNIPAALPVEADAPVEELPYAPALPLRMVIREVVRKIAGKVELTEARVVVSGGRGVRSREGFRVLEELADALGGAVGASRGACDAGYCDYALQIGQTGKVVTPELYIACGISGAIQHLAGMSQSRIIVAINIDPEAPIFQVADYGIVGDLFEVVPLMTQAIREWRSSSVAD
jgi:electron transfer flavoprotein alpha subunit